MNKFFITTPIYYVNDVPHIGHAYTTIAADVLARYSRQQLGQDNVFFLTGTDEHGAKIAQAAQEKNLDPKKYADEVVPQFQKSWNTLNINYDYFIRTTDPKHEKIASEVLQKIKDNGYIEEGTYEGLYCIGCEKFLTVSDLVNNKCPLHPNLEPVHQKEKNYFFKLSEFQDYLIELFEKDEVQILPKSRKNEILGKLKLGLEDISISREGVTWGIPVPWDNSQTIYVWVEALCNYYTATQFIEGKEAFWPASIHLVGKDIVWFHTVIWCSMLKAAELDLPKQVFAHGFFTIDGQKMSKSLGNVISPEQLVARYGTDGARYLLLSAFPFGDDGDFSFDKLDTQFNADLANGLGNLVARVAKLCEKNNTNVQDIPNSLDPNISNALSQYNFIEALNSQWSQIKLADKQINDSKPWELPEKEANEILTNVVQRIRNIAISLKPFMPETAEKIEKIFKGPKIISTTPLFPRLGLR